MSDIEEYRKDLKRTPGIEQTGYIRVMSKIVKDLSSGIYSSPANCIKEIINNSFDADATKVIVRAKPSLNLFSITDNGIGMSIEEFSEKFTVISKSYKRVESDYSEIYNRPLIGKIGIGFIAVSEICDKLIVISKKEGDTGRFKAELDFKTFKESESIDKNDEFYKKSKYKIVYEEVPEEKDDHYTKVILSELTSDFKQIIKDKDNVVLSETVDEKFNNKYFEEIVESFRNKKIPTYEIMGEYWKLIFDVARNVPVPYLEEGPIKLDQKDEVIESIKEKVKSYNFEVDFDGVILKKPILFPNEDRFKEYKSQYIVHSFEKEIGDGDDKLIFKGYLYSQHGIIIPREDIGILIRVKNVQVGEVDDTFLGYPFVTHQVLRHWTFGEIYIEQGLEDAMNIDRNSFRVTHKHYRLLKRFLHEYLDSVVFPYSLTGFYEAQKKIRAAEKVKQQQTKLKNAVRLDKVVPTKDVSVEIENDSKGLPVEIRKSESKVIVRSKAPVFKKFTTKEKAVVEELLVLFESAFQKALSNKEDIVKLKEYFYEFLESREK